MTWPQVGDPAVDYRYSRTAWDRERVSESLTVERVTQTMVVTSDGERYSRTHLHPISEGRHSDRTLVPATDLRVLAVRARDRLAEVAQATTNLSKLDHRTAEDVVAALANIVAMADSNRRLVLGLMREATEQEASR